MSKEKITAFIIISYASAIYLKIFLDRFCQVTYKFTSDSMYSVWTGDRITGPPFAYIIEDLTTGAAYEVMVTTFENSTGGRGSSSNPVPQQTGIGIKNIFMSLIYDEPFYPAATIA